uniref:Putative secreted protein n=1 Tax=Anopheles triannulatus TaxID=58253 RepID=A0A2M4B6H9_9DIPT
MLSTFRIWMMNLFSVSPSAAVDVERDENTAIVKCEQMWRRCVWSVTSRIVIPLISNNKLSSTFNILYSFHRSTYSNGLYFDMNSHRKCKIPDCRFLSLILSN